MDAGRGRPARRRPRPRRARRARSPTPRPTGCGSRPRPAAAHVRASLGDVAACAVLHERLRPFAGRVPTSPPAPFLGGIDLALARAGRRAGRRTPPPADTRRPPSALLDGARHAAGAGPGAARPGPAAGGGRRPRRPDAAHAAVLDRARIRSPRASASSRCSPPWTGCKRHPRSAAPDATRIQGAGATVGPWLRRIPPPNGRPPGRPTSPSFTVVHRAMRRDGARLAARARRRRAWPTPPAPGPSGAGTAASTPSWTGTTRSRTTCGSRCSPSGCRPSPSTPTASSASTTCSTTPCGASPTRSTGWSTPRRRPAPGPRPTTRRASCRACSTCTSGSRTPTCCPLYVRHFTEDEYADVEERARKLTRAAAPALRRAVGHGRGDPRRALDRVLDRRPGGLKLLWYASRRRHARLATRALGPATQGVA